MKNAILLLAIGFAVLVITGCDKSTPNGSISSLKTTINCHVAATNNPVYNEQETVYVWPTRVGIVLKINSFGTNVSGDVLSASVRVHYTDDMSFTDQAYLIKSENVKVGDKVALHYFMKRGYSGEDSCAIATKIDFSDYHGF